MVPVVSATKEVGSLLRNTFLEPNVLGFIGKEKIFQIPSYI